MIDVHPPIKRQHRMPLSDGKYKRTLSVPGRTAAYLRKSRVTNDEHMSWDVQRDEILALAERMGHNPQLFSDWNRSGREGKESRRPGYLEVVQLIESREIDILFAYDRSRLTRGLGELARLAALCRANGVIIHTVKEGVLDYTTPEARLVVQNLGSIAEYQAAQAQVRSLDVIKARRARGDRMGQTPYGYKKVRDETGQQHLALTTPDDERYEPVGRVVDLYRQHRTLLGVARLLNEEHIRTRRQGFWSSTTVKAIIEREAPDLLPARAKRGGKPWAPFLFYRLLRCHCGQILTGGREFRPSGTIRQARYTCSVAGTMPGHGKTQITERAIIGWAKEELAAWLAAVPETEVLAAQDRAADRQRLEGQRERIKHVFLEGEMDRADYDRRLEEIKDELAKIENASRATVVEKDVDWAGDPIAINGVLRAVWAEIELGADLLPVRALAASPTLPGPLRSGPTEAAA